MTTVALVDYRRTDLRTNVLTNPFWISSGLIVGADVEDKYALLFSFPRAGSETIIHQVYFQVVVAFTSSTLIDVGYSTLATDDVTTGGVATEVDADEYIKQGDITVGTIGFYEAQTGDWCALSAANVAGATLRIVGAATTVPCITALFSNTGTIAAGKGRVHMLISEVPGL